MQFILSGATKEEAYGLLMKKTFAYGHISVHMLPHMYCIKACFPDPANMLQTVHL